MKKSLTVPVLLRVIGALFGLAAFGMMFVAQGKVGGCIGNTCAYQSIELWSFYFGTANGDKGAVLPFVGYILAALGGICAIGTLFLKPSKKTRLAIAISGIFMIISAVFAFVGSAAYNGFNGVDGYSQLALGAILGGIFGAVAAVSMIGSLLAPEKISKKK